MRQLDRNVTFFAALALGLGSTALGQASWHLAYPPQSPPVLGFWGAAFDEVHGQALLLFPRGPSANQAWRWNGSAWSQLIGQLPPARSDSYVAWDAVRQRVVVFGGRSASSGQFLQDLWEWDGAVWQQQFASMPPPRDSAALAFDRTRGVLVMFGGWNGSVPLNDTWQWNGSTWSGTNPMVRPPGREQAAMAFDPTTQRVLLYGGQANAPAGFVVFNDTWSWNGTTWQQHFPATPPFYRKTPAMVADLARSRVVLFGGSTFDFQTWEWDGSEWHASNPGSPGPRWSPIAVYDTDRREVMLHGGESTSTGASNDTWLYRTASPATAVAFGAGCAGSAGVPVLANATYSLPWIGDTVRTRVSNLAPGALGAVFV
ncbi:MAG: kelch repeat-containing protein, partial [Planctomycetota bacterium]